jgi:hypothetical protein
MKDLEVTRINRIVKLHDRIIGNLKQSLNDAMQIGKLLTEQKASLNHGEFTPWVHNHLPFTDRTARNYMRLHRERDRLKTETVSDLKSAYKLLTAPNEKSLQAEINQLTCDFDKAGSNLPELKKLRDRAYKLSTEAAERMLNAEADLGEAIKKYMSTDYYEFTWTGLKKKREPTKQEIDEYWMRIKWLDDWHKRALKRYQEAVQ